ncbi:DNA polymerase II, partial [Pseudoalteromonas sp. SG41-6]
MTQAIYQGFILSRQQYSSKSRRGITLCYWLVSEQGPIKVLVEDQQAVFFIPQEKHDFAKAALNKANLSANFKVVDMRHFSGAACIGCYFNDASTLYKARTLLEPHLSIYEADIRHSDRFLMERFIKGGVWVTGDVSQKDGFILINNAKLKASPEYTPTLTSLSLDIECNGEGVLFS